MISRIRVPQNFTFIMEEQVELIALEKKAHTQQTTVEDLLKCGALTVRTYNACKAIGLITLNDIHRYYRQHGDFRSVRNCGAIGNYHLVNICKNYPITTSSEVALKGEPLTFTSLEHAQKALMDGTLDVLVIARKKPNQHLDTEALIGKVGFFGVIRT